MNQELGQVLKMVVLLIVVMNLVTTLHASPIDLYDVVDATIGANNEEEKFLLKMVDYFTEPDSDGDLEGDGDDGDGDYGRQPVNKTPMSRNEMCNLPQRKGLCRALIPRWRYDATAKDCTEFKFGGCDGNLNNFSTYNNCMDACKGV